MVGAAAAVVVVIVAVVAFFPFSSVSSFPSLFSFSFPFLINFISQTVGYGNIVPRTVPGRLFFIVYALIGIPGTCLTLKAVGDKMAEHFAKLLTALERRFLKKEHPRNVDLKVALTTIFLTVCILLPLCALIVKLRHDQWTYLECFYFTFTTLSTIGFGDYLPQFQNDADYFLVLLAFVGLAFVSSIFCSINNVLEQYGVSARIVRSLKDNSTQRATKGAHQATLRVDSHEVPKNTAGGSLKRNLNVTGEEMPPTSRNSLPSETKKSRKRSSTINLGVFTC